MDKKKRLIVLLSSQEEDMINKLEKKYGFSTSEFIRELIRNYYRKEFPAYRAKVIKSVESEEEELTPEQACERAGGTVSVRNGIPMCVFKIHEGMTSAVPLTRPDLFIK